MKQIKKSLIRSSYVDMLEGSRSLGIDVQQYMPWDCAIDGMLVIASDPMCVKLVLELVAPAARGVTDEVRRPDKLYDGSKCDCDGLEG